MSSNLFANVITDVNAVAKRQHVILAHPIRTSEILPKGNSRGRFFYPTFTLMMVSYNITCMICSGQT